MISCKFYIVYKLYKTSNTKVQPTRKLNFHIFYKTTPIYFLINIKYFFLIKFAKSFIIKSIKNKSVKKESKRNIMIVILTQFLLSWKNIVIFLRVYACLHMYMYMFI